jgi:hypothetical protein
MRTAAVVLAAAGLAGGCSFSVNGFGSPGVESVETLDVEAPAAKALSVDSRAGSIHVAPASKAGNVHVVATKRAPTTEDLARIKVSAAVAGDEVRVGYAVEGSTNGISVSFAVEAPAALRCRLESGAGSIEVQGFESGLKAETGAGSVEIEGRPGGDCSLVTSAGSVQVTLPSDSRLKIEARTSAGSARSDFPLRVEGEPGSRGLSGTLGDGSEGTLRIETSAGSVRVRSK